MNQNTHPERQLQSTQRVFAEFITRQVQAELAAKKNKSSDNKSKKGIYFSAVLSLLAVTAGAYFYLQHKKKLEKSTVDEQNSLRVSPEPTAEPRTSPTNQEPATSYNFSTEQNHAEETSHKVTQETQTDIPEEQLENESAHVNTFDCDDTDAVVVTSETKLKQDSANPNQSTNSDSSLMSRIASGLNFFSATRPAPTKQNTSNTQMLTP